MPFRPKSRVPAQSWGVESRGWQQSLSLSHMDNREFVWRILSVNLHLYVAELLGYEIFLFINLSSKGFFSQISALSISPKASWLPWDEKGLLQGPQISLFILLWADLTLLSPDSFCQSLLSRFSSLTPQSSSPLPFHISGSHSELSCSQISHQKTVDFMPHLSGQLILPAHPLASCPSASPCP